MSIIWVIDDEPAERRVVREALEQEGMNVREFNGADGVVRALEDQEPDLIILDVLMPEQKGTDLCRDIQAESDVPIIFLSSADEPIDRVVGLEVGGDDYLTKPFHPRELAARVRAVLRRQAPDDRSGENESGADASDDEDPSLEVGRLRLNPTSMTLHLDDAPLEVTKTEFKLLETLMSNPEKVFSRQELMEDAYEGARVSEKTIDSHIRRLRAHFEPSNLDPIRTVRGVGYSLDADALEP